MSGCNSKQARSKRKRRQKRLAAKNGVTAADTREIRSIYPPSRDEWDESYSLARGRRGSSRRYL